MMTFDHFYYTPYIIIMCFILDLEHFFVIYFLYEPIWIICSPSNDRVIELSDIGMLCNLKYEGSWTSSIANGYFADVIFTPTR